MEVEAQVAHFLRFSSPAVRSVGRPRCALELGHPAGGRPFSCYPRHPMCSPLVTPPSGRHFCETAQHD
eukprot:6690186-Prymnesium_polylepis.1